MNVWLATQKINGHFYIWYDKAGLTDEKLAKTAFLKDFFGNASNVESRFGNQFQFELLKMRNNVAELVVNQHVSFEIIPKDR